MWLLILWGSKNYLMENTQILVQALAHQHTYMWNETFFLA